MDHEVKMKQSHFPTKIFGAVFVSMLLVAGIHTGIVHLFTSFVNTDGWILTGIVLVYWICMAAAFTAFTRYQIIKTYEEPMQKLARATSEVAHGDFSIYVPTINTPDQLDYLDVMIMHFNKMVAELGSIETLKTDFFSNVSHEINPPLAVISNHAQILKAKGNLNEDQMESVTAIITATKKLSNLITNILKLNRLEKQTIEPESEEYDLCEQLCDCILQFENCWDEKQIELEVDVEDYAAVKADPNLMELVWNNLLSNAVKFTEPGGTVKIKEVSTDTQIRVESYYLDGFENFGWEIDDRFPKIVESNAAGKAVIRLKRNRKIMNKAELTRLQCNFEDCIRQISSLQSNKTSQATIVSLVIAIIGTAFMAGSVFAVTHEPPLILIRFPDRKKEGRTG